MRPPPGEERRLSIVLVPHGGRDSRTFHLSYRRLRALALLAGLLGVGLALMAGSWWYLAARASRTARLERQVAEMVGDRERLVSLVQRLENIEDQYEKIRVMFGASDAAPPSDAWLPPPAAPRRAAGSEPRRAGPTAPTVWPLTERGFITQGLHDGIEGRHPGLDVAVPTGSYIRAAGGGVVTDVGEDAVYGRYVVIDHGSGYATLYGHASISLVELGQTVRERQIIALSGSTGRSTGPHLHFEILVEGEPVDPLTMVEQPT